MPGYIRQARRLPITLRPYPEEALGSWIARVAGIYLLSPDALLSEYCGLDGEDLSELDLSDTSVTDEGIKHLKALTKLKKLWLDNTGVTEQGLENLRSLGQLTKVSLIGVKVTEPACWLTVA